MLSCLVLSLALLFTFRDHLVRAQTATCLDGYNWMFNERGQSPCDMAGYLYSACTNESVIVEPLEPDHYYGGPASSAYATLCACSTITWSLFCACATCQNRTTAAWSVWTEYCTSKLEMTFPFDIPSQTVIPHWAYLDYGEYGMWDENAAKANAEAEKSPPKKSVPVGAIVGGIIGGLAFVAIMIGILCVVIRRRRAAARRPAGGPGRVGAPPSAPGSPSVSSEPLMHQRLYNLSDPIPLPSHAPSTTTYTSSTGNSLGYGQSSYTANDRTVVY